MANSKTWRGETGICGVLGNDEHRLKYAQRNLASTEHVLIGAAASVGRSIAALQSHQQILRASLVRMKAADFQPPFWMNAEETKEILEAQLEIITKSLHTATKLNAQLLYKSTDVVGPFGKDKDYTLPQIDELTNETLETYVQQLDTYEKLPKDHIKGWWDASDPATWIPNGWKPNDTQKWCRYARLATEEGHGLVPYYGIPQSEIGWDPKDPLTWVPFGWRIKNESLWQDWHKSQQAEESDESPHAGLLAPEPEWNEVEAASIKGSSGADPHKDTQSTFDEAYGVGGQKGKHVGTRGRFAGEASKSQPKPCSPFGKDDYEAYHANKMKQKAKGKGDREDAGDGPTPEWREFEAGQCGRPC